MHYLIKDGAIVGKTENPGAWEGWEIAEFEDHDIPDLWWTGTAIALKPPKPASPWAVWEDGDWVIREPVVEVVDPVPPVPVRNFKGLESAFRNSEIFGKVAAAAAASTEANFYLTMILYGLSGGQMATSRVDEESPSANDLAFGFIHIRPIMQSLGLDFTESQLETIRLELIKNNFDPLDFGFEEAAPPEDEVAE